MDVERNKEESFAEEIKQQISLQEYKSLRKSLKEKNLADIASAIDSFKYSDLVTVFRLTPRSKRSELFSFLPEIRQIELVEELPETVILSFISDMESDDRTYLFQELPGPTLNRLLAKLGPKDRKNALKLLSYPDDSVGRLMNIKLVSLPESLTVAEAISQLRWKLTSSEDQRVEQFYVITRDGKFLGTISPVDLLAADPPTLLIKDIYQKSDIYLSGFEDQEVAVDYFRKYDQYSFPVVDSNQVLVGYISSDDVFDVAEEEATEDIHRFGGLDNLEESYFNTSIFKLVRKRGVWLALLFIGEMFTSAALHYYDKEIAKFSFFIYFLPLIISSGGNSGSQAASIVIRGIAVKEIPLGSWKKLLGKEFVVSLILGLIVGGLGVVRALTWGHKIDVILIIFLTLVAIVVFGAVLGALLPILFSKLNQDPAVSSSPFIASIVDLVGVLVFIHLALFITYYFG